MGFFGGKKAIPVSKAAPVPKPSVKLPTRTAAPPARSASDGVPAKAAASTPREESGSAPTFTENNKAQHAFDTPEQSHKRAVAAMRPGDGAYVAVTAATASATASDEAFALGKVVKVTEAAVTLAMPSGEKRSFPHTEVNPVGPWAPSDPTNDLCGQCW